MHLENLQPGASLERLDQGVFYEVIGRRGELEKGTEEESCVFGQGDVDCAYWSGQVHENAGGIACLGYAIAQLTDARITDQELCDRAERLGRFDPEMGISTGDMMAVLKSYRLSPEYSEDTSMQMLMEILEEGKALCLVNSFLLEGKGHTPYEGSTADAFVQVIEINVQNPLNPFIRLNVPFSSDGAGKKVDLQTFSRAWKAGNRAVICVGRSNVQ